MPGPGGGARGGGFSGGSRGGGFSGGSGGGGYHGGYHGHHHGPHHHHGPIFIFGPRRRYYYGGSGGGGGSSAGAVLALLMIMIACLVIFSALLTTCEFEEYPFKEDVFQDYANDQYYALFDDTRNFEENILILLATFEGYDGYDCIAWVGDDLPYGVRMMFGDETTYFGKMVTSHIPNHYEYSLTSNLRDITNLLADEVVNLAGEPSGKTEKGFSKLVNNTELKINESTVNEALEAFTEKTGYNIAIVVASGEEIFAEEQSETEIVMIVLICFFVALLIAFIVTKVKKGPSDKKKTTDKTDPDAGQGKYDPNTGTWV